MYQLYRILNSKSSSSYIGMTSRGLHRRMKEHRWAAINDKKTPLYDAMRAYGVDNFSIVLIEEFDTRQECMQAEIDLIEKKTSCTTLLPEAMEALWSLTLKRGSKNCGRLAEEGNLHSG